MFSYEKLEVYKKAYLTNQRVYQLIKGSSTIPLYTKNQLGRACLSIMLNIAEGSAKFSDKDRRNYYVTARGSAFECSSLICFLYDQREMESDLKEILYLAFEEISKMLFAMIKNLDTREKLVK